MAMEGQYGTAEEHGQPHAHEEFAPLRSSETDGWDGWHRGREPTAPGGDHGRRVELGSRWQAFPAKATALMVVAVSALTVGLAHVAMPSTASGATEGEPFTFATTSFLPRSQARPNSDDGSSFSSSVFTTADDDATFSSHTSTSKSRRQKSSTASSVSIDATTDDTAAHTTSADNDEDDHFSATLYLHDSNVVVDAVLAATGKSSMSGESIRESDKRTQPTNQPTNQRTNQPTNQRTNQS